MDMATGLWVRDEYVMDVDCQTIKDIFEITSFSDKVDIPEYEISEFLCRVVEECRLSKAGLFNCYQEKNVPAANCSRSRHVM